MRQIDADALIETLNDYGVPYYADIDYFIKCAPTIDAVSEWIPCSERLPKEYGEYICTMKNGQVQECGFVPEKRQGLITGWSTCEADGHKLLRNKDVLAWMPLPAPYGGESNG